MPSLIEVTAEEMNICVINLHPSNAYCPIEVTEGGIVISVNDEHPECFFSNRCKIMKRRDFLKRIASSKCTIRYRSQ